MRIPVKIVCVTGVLIIALTSVAWSGDPKYTEDDIEKLCEIHSRMPVTKMIRIDHKARPKISPVVVHRCQQLTFKVDQGAASISITDSAISQANRMSITGEEGAVVQSTLVLWVTAGGEGATIEVPEDYPHPTREVEVRYHTECYDPDAAEPYECQGTSPPIFIIPPTRPPG